MKRTLFQITEAILNEMDADEVTTIGETFESEQVAAIVRDSFFSIIDSRNWPHLKKFTTLTATSLATYAQLEVPDTVKEIIFIRYNMQRDSADRNDFQDLKYLHPDEFISMLDRRDSTASNVIVSEDITNSAIVLNVMNDRPPKYWTSFDDKHITIDSFDQTVELVPLPTSFQVYVYDTPVWDHCDTYVPDLPEEAHTLLLEESKSTAFLVLKQMVNEKAESRSRTADSWLARKAFVAHGGVRYPNYGRRKNPNYKPHPLGKN